MSIIHAIRANFTFRPMTDIPLPSDLSTLSIGTTLRIRNGDTAAVVQIDRYDSRMPVQVRYGDDDLLQWLLYDGRLRCLGDSPLDAVGVVQQATAPDPWMAALEESRPVARSVQADARQWASLATYHRALPNDPNNAGACVLELRDRVEQLKKRLAKLSDPGAKTQDLLDAISGIEDPRAVLREVAGWLESNGYCNSSEAVLEQAQS